MEADKKPGNAKWLLVLALVVATAAVAFWGGREHNRREAVDNGAAKWTMTDQYGSVKFEWTTGGKMVASLK